MIRGGGFSCFDVCSSFVSLPLSALVFLLPLCSLTFSSLEMAHPMRCWAQIYMGAFRKDFSGVPKRVVFKKGGFGGSSPGAKTGTRVHSAVPPKRKPERGYIRQNHAFTKPLDERQITHLICARIKYDLYDFFRGCFGAFYTRKRTGSRPKTPLKSHIGHILGGHRLDE